MILEIQVRHNTLDMEVAVAIGDLDFVSETNIITGTATQAPHVRWGVVVFFFVSTGVFFGGATPNFSRVFVCLVQIRMYDTRAQRRPVMDVKAGDNPIRALCTARDDRYAFPIFSS
jgi:hypothetical protein